jgi:transposase
MLMQPQSLDDLSAEQLREMTARLLTELRHSHTSRQPGQ